jgi:hypothetical protein
VESEKPKKSGDSAEEKIKSRAERFGGFQSDDAKKAARAAKFGEMLAEKPQAVGKVAVTQVLGASSLSLSTLSLSSLSFSLSLILLAVLKALSSQESLDAIKKRGDRFGTVRA